MNSGYYTDAQSSQCPRCLALLTINTVTVNVDNKDTLRLAVKTDLTMGGRRRRC